MSFCVPFFSFTERHTNTKHNALWRTELTALVGRRGVERHRRPIKWGKKRQFLQQNYILLWLLLLWLCWQGTQMNLVCSGRWEAKEAFETRPEASVQKSKNAFIKQNTYMETHRWKSATEFPNTWNAVGKVQKSSSSPLLPFAAVCGRHSGNDRHGDTAPGTVEVIQWHCAVKIMQLIHSFTLAVCATTAFGSLFMRSEVERV